MVTVMTFNMDANTSNDLRSMEKEAVVAHLNKLLEERVQSLKDELVNTLEARNSDTREARLTNGGNSDEGQITLWQNGCRADHEGSTPSIPRHYEALRACADAHQVGSGAECREIDLSAGAIEPGPMAQAPMHVKHLKRQGR